MKLNFCAVHFSLRGLVLISDVRRLGIPRFLKPLLRKLMIDFIYETCKGWLQFPPGLSMNKARACFLLNSLLFDWSFIYFLLFKMYCIFLFLKVFLKVFLKILHIFIFVSINLRAMAFKFHQKWEKKKLLMQV